MKKRTEIFCREPAAYEISCNLCGGEVRWSDYPHKVWCWRCLKDVPGNPGIFGGPIPLEACETMGLCLDKIDLATGERLYLKVKGSKIVWEKEKYGNSI